MANKDNCGGHLRLRKSLRKSCSKLFNRAKSTRYANYWNSYKENLEIFRKELWNLWNFCGNIEETSKTTRLRNVFATIPRTLSYLVITDGLWTSSCKEYLELLMDTHFLGALESRYKMIEMIFLHIIAQTLQQFYW